MKRPFSDSAALQRGAPFVILAFVAVVVELLTGASSSDLALVAAAGVTAGALLVAAFAVPWGRLPSWCDVIVPLGFFVVVALLRDARGGASSGYPPLVLLPVVWLAVYGTRAQLRMAIAGLAATLLVPMIVVGAPRYPASGWGLPVLAVAIGALAGTAIQQIVEQSRQRAADVAALGVVARALTAGADPRPDLCAAAALIAGAGFAVLFEPDDDGVLIATAGTHGLDPGLLRVDPGIETSATAQVWNSGIRLYLSDVVGDPRASRRLTELTGVAAALFAPVTRDGRRMAVLVVGFTHTRPRLPEPALDLVELVAAEIAAAIDRADLVALLAEQARTDPLTGAANRRSWDESLDRELARAERTGDPLTVALVDMDHFKAYNDEFGHNAGDVVLRDLVLALRAELRTGDLIARWGGEEFALALPVCDMAHAQQIAARLLGVIPGGQTASIGLTQAGFGDTPRSLIGRADRALYAAKDGGRNQVGVLPAPSRLGPAPGTIERAAS
ncbi:GGDEF domain-containing protein [Pengzhenrongella phosphoraccumulans]|uniref:sensor domain-containing diguanylate cyclase n=1 Tax=Pengzhenrongella phosphoraccumulans TaxID=3114394 RepID=UPI00388F48DD